VAQSNAQLIEDIQAQLVIFNNAQATANRAYQHFLCASQSFNFVAAEDYQLAFSANMDVAMDAFMICCQLQKKIKDAQG